MELRISLLTAVLAVSAIIANAEREYPELPQRIFDETPEQKAERMQWWQDVRFGMFIHFGLYAMPARHEWVRSREYIDNETYDSKYFTRFNPNRLDVRAWARAAKRAGMKYIVLTTKHHEGFCLWDTATTDYKVTRTPYGRDIVRDYVEACRAEGLRVGFYFSVIDWHHPDYTVDFNHPLRPPPRREIPFSNIGTFEPELDAKYAELNKNRDMNRYRAYMFAQVRELLSNYGKIDIIWFDYTPKGKFGKTYKDWNSIELIKMARSLQPGIIVDSRLDLMETDDGWDFVCPEQTKIQAAPTVRGKRVPWEVCQTFSGSWGYYRDETTWKSLSQLIDILTEAVSKGGNLILNVGPTAKGEFDARAIERLEGLGRWMHDNSDSIYGCGEAPAGLVAPEGTHLTYNKSTRRLYIHIHSYPPGFLPVAFWEKIEYAQFLHDGSEITLSRPPRNHAQSGDGVSRLGGLRLPVVKPAVEVPVVEVFLAN